MTLEKLKKEYATAVLHRDYYKVNTLMQSIKIEQQRKETVSLSSLLTNMTKEERSKALCLMHKLFVFSDILYGSALEFSEYLKTFDKSIDIEVVNQAKQASDLCRGITKNVDWFKDEKMSEDFGNMCDEIQTIAMNSIYKRQTKFK